MKKLFIILAIFILSTISGQNIAFGQDIHLVSPTSILNQMKDIGPNKVLIGKEIVIVKKGDTIHIYSTGKKGPVEIYDENSSVVPSIDDYDYLKTKRSTYEELLQMTAEQCEEIGEYQAAHSKYLERGNAEKCAEMNYNRARILEEHGNYKFAFSYYLQAFRRGEAYRMALKMEDEGHNLLDVARCYEEIGIKEEYERIMERVRKEGVEKQGLVY